MLHRHTARMRSRDVMRRDLLHAKCIEALLDMPELERIRRPRGHCILRRHDRRGATGPHDQLRHVTAQVEPIVVEDHHVTRWNPSGHQIVRCQNRVAETRDRSTVRSTVPITPPGRTRREHDMRRAKLQHLVGRDVRRTIHTDVRQLLDLRHAPVTHAHPFREARQPRLFQHASTQLTV